MESLLTKTSIITCPGIHHDGNGINVESGPGGTGLLTLRAREVIDSAEVILYDQSTGEGRSWILFRHPPEKIDCGKYGSNHTLEQDEIEEVVGRPGTGRETGSPAERRGPVFGRGGEDEVLIAHGIPVEVVPGVTSAVAVPAAVGIPLTHRKYASQVTILTGHEDPKKAGTALDWELLAKGRGTIVILMGVENFPQYCRFAAHSRKKS